MFFVLVVLLLATAVGAARGGTPGGLGLLALRRRGLVVIAVLCQLLGTLAGGVAYPVGLALSAAIAAWFLSLNARVRGVGLVALGLVSNAVVVGANGAMPVSAYASGLAGVSTQAIVAGDDRRHELATSATVLRPLGDVIPVLLPVRPEVVSPGDVLLAAGLAQILVIGMGRRRRPAE